MYRQIRYIMVVTAVLNIVLSIILGPYLGVAGILFATSISKLLTYFWYEPYVLFKKVFNAKPYKYYFEYLTNGIVLVISGIVCFYLTNWIVVDSWIKWLTKAGVCFLCINIIYFLRYFKTEEFNNMLQKVRVIMKR